MTNALSILEQRVETLKQRSDSSPLHAELDAMVADVRGAIQGGETAGTPDAALAPEGSPEIANDQQAVPPLDSSASGATAPSEEELAEYRAWRATQDTEATPPSPQLGPS